MRRLTVDPLRPADPVIGEAAGAIGRAGVVAFPTDTLYGLAVDPFAPLAVERLFAVKGRASTQAIALVAADVAQVEQWLGRLSVEAGRLAARFWPGPLTILVSAAGPEPEPGTAPVQAPVPVQGPGVRTVTGSGPTASQDLHPRPPYRYALAPGIAAADGTVGVRVPDHAVARALCRTAGRPLTATSANLSGQPPSADPDEVGAALDGRIDLLLDAGRTPGGPPSTIVDASGASLRLVRAGAVDWETIQQCARGE